MRRVSLILLALIAFVAGVWFGEDPSVFASFFGLLPSLACLGVGALVATLAFLLSAQARALAGVLCAALCLSALAAGVLAGGRESRAAYAECFAGRESLRAALEAHRQLHGGFPAALAELEVPVPRGALAVRGSLLRYQRTPEGYQIIFRGPVFIHVATQTHPFTSGI